MRWFKRSSADTPHLKRLSPLTSNELLVQTGGSLHPAVLAANGGNGGDEGRTTSASTTYGGGGNSRFQSREVGSRNEFLSVSMNGATTTTTTTNGYYDDEQQRWQQYADASKRSDSDRHSRTKENRRDWRRSYNRNTINCYNIQEGKIVNSTKSRDRSLSPSFLRRKRSDVMDVRKIFETKKTKETKETTTNSSQDFSANTVRIRSRNNLVKERRNPLTTTRLSFCETKLIYDDNTSYSTYQNAMVAHQQSSINVESLAPRLNEMLNISTSTVNRPDGSGYATSRIYNNHERENERYKTKVNKNSASIINKSKSVEDFTKEDIMAMNRINKPENKFKTLSGKTQKFLSNFYKTRWDKTSASGTPSKQYLLQSSPDNQPQHNNHYSYEPSIRYAASDLPMATKSTGAADDLMNTEWYIRSHCPLSDSCYSTMVDSTLMTTSTDADSGILENDSGQSSLNSLPVAESISTLASTATSTSMSSASSSSNDPGMMMLNDASSSSFTTTNGNSHNHSDSQMMANSDFLVTVLCDESFKEISKHLYHSKESYFMTNIIVKKIKLVDGFILAGDEILDICGIPIRGKPYIEVYNLLQNIHRNSRNDYVRIVVRRISELTAASSSSSGNGNGLTNAYQKGVVNSRRNNGIGGLLRDMERTSEKSLDYAATAIRIDGSRSKLKPPIDTPTSQRRSSEQSAFKVASMHFQKNISAYGSISRKFIRRSVLGRAASSSVIDVSQIEPEITTTVQNAEDDAHSMPNSLCSDTDSINTTQIEKHPPPISSNFFTLPRKNKIGVYGFHTIRFEKGPGKKSLGFTIVGGRDSPKGAIGIFVKRILSTGQAIDDGRLRVGDEILSVNGQVCHDLSHEEAVKMFKSIRTGEIVLRVCRREKQNLGGGAAVTSSGGEGRNSNRDSQITTNSNDT